MKNNSLLDVIVVGAGFAGLRALYTLRKQGFSVTVLESSDEVGGVWNHNRYPGARCDVESYDYSYGFSKELEQEWRWTERYATQGEVLSYIRYAALKFDLHKDIRFNSRVTAASYNEADSSWNVSTEKGEQLTSRFLVMAVGQLSKTKWPKIPGAETFSGVIYHSGEWPREHIHFEGKRVGIIGTGSSGVQMTPVIARAADQLKVFQRTANFSIPASHAYISDEEDAEVKEHYKERRAQCRNSPTGLGFLPNKKSALDDSPADREAVFETAYIRLGFGFALAYYDLLLNQDSNDLAADFLRRKIAEKVEDPTTREKLTPRGFPFGAMRPSVDDGYYEAFNRDNVELVDVKEKPILEITPTGLTTAGDHYPLDMIIYATGFDVFTGSLLAPRIVGRNGMTLEEKWQHGPTNYLGLSTANFPNLFIMVGPGSPSLLSNVLLSSEEHADFICGMITHMEQNNIIEMEATADAEKKWVEHVNQRSQETLYPKARSYYNGDEIAGKPHVFMPYSGGVRGYRGILQKVVAADYEGFQFETAKQ
jgi:cyclohexanone monooxygenase